ncbi:MAG TPA: hypothetical protein VFB66_04195, partial [Tepidisphaeraceae bacterium]|nr:hypothetical protein [Tepidisphaeraceae bacterium]
MTRRPTDRRAKGLFSFPWLSREKAHHTRPARDARLFQAVDTALEPLEQRMLMAVDTPLQPNQFGAIKSGLAGLSNWADTLDNFGDFAKQLPVVGRSIGQSLNLGDTLRTSLVDPLNNLAGPTPNQLATAIQNHLPGTTVTAIDDPARPNEILFNVTLNKTRSENRPLDFGANAESVSADASFTAALNTKLGGSFTFGFDTTGGLSPSEAFFVRFAPGSGFVANASVGINPANFGIGLGSLGPDASGNAGARVVNGNVALSGGVSAALVDQDADGKVTLDELDSTTLDSMVSISRVHNGNDLSATLPVQAKLGTFTGSGTVTVTDADLFDATAPAVALSSTNLTDFKNLTPAGFVALLRNVGTSLQATASGLNPDGGIPFVGEAMSQAVNFGDLFNELTRPLFDTRLTGAASYTSQSEALATVTEQARFTLTVTVGANSFSHNVTAGTGALSDVVNSINNALVGTSLSGLATATLEGTRVKLAATTADHTLTVQFHADDKGMEQLGFEDTLANAAFRFSSIQSAIPLLAQKMGVVPAALNVDYDAATKALLFSIKYTDTFDRQVELNFTDTVDLGLGKLAVTGELEAAVTGTATADFRMGVNVGNLADFDPANPNPDQDPLSQITGNDFFVQTGGKVTANARFQGGGDLSAALGMLEMGVHDASADFNVTGQFTLGEPAPGDTKIEPGEFIKPGVLSAPTFTAGGNVVLPLGLADADTVGVTVPNDAAVTLNFESGPPISVDADVQGLDDLIEQFGNFSTDNVLGVLKQLVDLIQNSSLPLFNEPLPLVGKSLRELLSFGQSLADGLSTATGNLTNLRKNLLGDTPNAGLVGALKNAIGNTPLLNTLNAAGAAGEEVAHHIAHAVEAVEDAAKALAEVVDDAATFKLPSGIVSAVSTLTHALHHAEEYAETLPAGQPRQTIEAGLAQLESGLDAITKVLPAVQRLASYLFDALNLGQLVNFSALETAVRPALQQTLDGLADNPTNAAARADIAEVIDLLDGALGAGNTFAALGGPAALAGPGDLDSFKLLQGLDGLRKLVDKYGTPQGVLADDPAVNNEPGDFIRQALASYLASLPGKPDVEIVGDDLNIGFDFSIARGPFFQSLDFDLADIVGNGVAQYLPLDIKSGGEVELSVGAELKLDFGVDLAHITSDPLSALFFRDSTELSLNALIQSTNFTATASIGSVDAITLGPAGHPGTLTLKNDANDGPARFGLGLNDTANHKIPFNQFGLDDFGLIEDGSLNLSVPILVDDTFVTTDGSNNPANIDPLSLTMTDLRDFKTLDFNIPDRLAETLEQELFSLDFLIKGLRAYIDKLTGGMLTDIIRKFPFIGNTLDLLTSSLAKLLAPPTTGTPAGGNTALAAAAPGATSQVAPGEGFLDQVEGRINQLISDGKADASKLLEKFVEDALKQLFFDLLGPKSSGGLGVLKLRADTSAPGDTTIDFNDVMIDVQGNLNSLSDTKIIAYLPLEGANELAHADFDLGFDGLGLVGFHTQGNVELNLTWSVDLAFEISKTGGFTVLLDSNPFNPNDTDEVAVGVVANLSPGATLNANLFFLALEATDRNGLSNLHANAVLDIEKAGDRLPINDFSGIKFKPALSGGMLIDLALRTGISTGAITPNSNLPSMQADLLVDWGFNINPDTGFSAESPVVELNNIGLDLGEFVSKALGPVIDMLDDYLAPIKPLLDFLNQEIPVISQVAQLVGLDPVRFIDAIGALGSGAATVQRLVDVLTAITDLLADIQAIADAGSVVIPLGDIKFGKGDQLDRKKNTFSAANIGDRFKEKFADAYENIDQAGQAAKDFIDGLTGNNQGASALAPQANAAFGSVETALGTFSIPLFQSPIKIVDLLFGKDVDLVTWDIPRLEAKFEFSQLFGPIIPPFPVFAKIGGGFGIFCDLYMGMDTRGIRTGDFFKGVYFGDTLGAQDGAKEVPELGVTMEFKAGAELSIPFAKAGIEGGIQAQITADWNDPDDNGKVHFDELAENFSHGLQCVFDLAGKLDAFIGAYLNIEIPLGITSITIIDVSFDIFRATLFDFSYTCPPLPAPVPGTNDNGTLRLNIGDRAGQRQPGATDGDETVKVFGEMDRNGDGTITRTQDINGDGKITEEEMGDDLDGDGVIEDGVLALSGFGVFQIVGGGSGPAITSIVANAGAGKDSITLDKSVRVAATINGG